MNFVFPLAMAIVFADDRNGTEAELVAASRRGDEAAFAVLVRRHQARVFSLASRFFRNREDVEDVAQETFFAAWRRLGTYEARAPFEHWITRICLRRCYAQLDAKHRQDVELPVSDPAALSHDPTLAIDIERLLAKLAPADRFVLLLLDGEGWSVKEVAERIGWTATNVKVRAFRARHRLRRLIEEGS